MKKKIKKSEDIEKTFEEVVMPSVQVPISLITIDFGREDLNQLRDKLNEVISRLF